MSDQSSRRPSLQFGANVDPTADVSAVMARTALAEELGYDLALLQDHTYNPRFADTWTLLAARTERMQLGPNVLTTPLHLPAMIAKSAATIDLISDGRLVLGLGAGAFAAGIRGLGAAFGESPGGRLGALRETIEIIRGLWTSDGQPFTYEGTYHRVANVTFAPVPTRHIPIWTGVTGDRALRMTGEMADGVLVSSTYVPVGDLPRVNARLDEGAAHAGRNPNEVRRAYNVMGRVELPGDRRMRPKQPGLLWGDAAWWAETLTTLSRDHRIDTFIF